MPRCVAGAADPQLRGIARIIELAVATCPPLPGGDPGAGALVLPNTGAGAAGSCGGLGAQACLQAGCAYDQVEGCYSEGH